MRIKLEHSGDKRHTDSSYHGYRSEAKRVTRKLRREQDRMEQDAELFFYTQAYSEGYQVA